MGARTSQLGQKGAAQDTLDESRALGGLRCARLSVLKLPQSDRAGLVLRTQLLKCLQSTPGLLSDMLGSLGNDVTTVPGNDVIRHCREMVAKGLGISSSISDRCSLWPRLFTWWRQQSSDPETEVEKWMLEGAPMGLAKGIPSSGIFPNKHDGQCVGDPELLITPDDWEEDSDGCNYVHAKAEMEKLTHAGYVNPFPNRAALRSHRFLNRVQQTVSEDLCFQE